MLNSTYELIVIRTPKRIDSFTALPLFQDLEQRIPEHGAVVLDLSHTQVITPESADVILKALMLAKQRQCQLSLRGVKPQVSTVLEMSGVLKFFRKS